MILSASSVSVYAPKITVSAQTIIDGNYIPIVQERINLITNNYFTIDDLSFEAQVLYNATARSIILDTGLYWENYGFQANDDFYIYNSWRNNGVFTIDSLSNETLIVSSSQSVVNERFNTNLGPVTFFGVIKWPISLKQIAGKMIWYDADYRDKNPEYLRSRSLGPLSESFGSSDLDDQYGYPLKVIQALEPFKIARFN